MVAGGSQLWFLTGSLSASTLICSPREFNSTDVVSQCQLTSVSVHEPCHCSAYTVEYRCSHWCRGWSYIWAHVSEPVSYCHDEGFFQALDLFQPQQSRSVQILLVYALSFQKQLFSQWYIWIFLQASWLPAALQQCCTALGYASALTVIISDFSSSGKDHELHNFRDPSRWKVLHVGKLSLFVIILSLIHFGRQMCILSPPPNPPWELMKHENHFLDKEKPTKSTQYIGSYLVSNLWKWARSNRHSSSDKLLFLEISSFHGKVLSWLSDLLLHCHQHTAAGQWKIGENQLHVEC